MLRTAKTFLIGVITVSAFSQGGTTAVPTTAPTAAPYSIGAVLFSDDFRDGTKQWAAELEAGGRVVAEGGKLVMDVPAGCTVWFRPRLEGRVTIEYDATVVRAGGPNDRVSDLNCFWMATDPAHPDDLFVRPRDGKFEHYNELLTYYVGQGGNGNTTTRFRRYVGDKVKRPLLPEHDLSDKADLLTPNVSQHITLIACDGLIEYYRDGKRVFRLDDPKPYTAGWFGFRTVTNHMEISNFRVRRLESKKAGDK